MAVNSVQISIVIVNYKSWHHLTNCLNALTQIPQNNFTFEVVVVDNCSNDGKLTEFKTQFSRVNFVKNSGNNGFANGCNVGAKNASGEYLLFLNPDTIANEEAIQKMYEFAKNNTDVGIVSCHQKNNNGSYEKVTRFSPDFSTLFGLSRAFYKLLNKKHIASKYNSKQSVIYPDWVSGSVVFIHKNVFHKIDCWNEDYWMYFEDVDLSKKVANSGLKIALLQDVELIHNHGGASRINIATASLTKTEVLISKHVYIANHFTGFKRFILQFLLVLNNLLFKFVSGVLGVVLFFIPKMKLNFFIFKKLSHYYINCLLKSTWLSERSMNYKS